MVVVATDLSPGMLGRAAGKAGGRMGNARFVVTDAEDLAFKDGVFDAVVASFVFCTVPDPVRGLSEARRVWIRLRAASWGPTSTAGRWITSERPAWSFWKSGTSSPTGSSSSWLDKEELR
jgi:SAM-dependent methyltransferase